MFALDDFTQASLVLGVLLIVMTLSSSFISRLPLSAAMLYLLVGIGLGPTGINLLRLDPLRDSVLLERLTEVAVLISLFVAGMKLDLPLTDRRWRIPLRLASVSMVVTVGAITAVGYWLLHLPLGAAVLLGAVLAPTDPVLASDVQMADASDRDRLRFGLTGEGGLNDGTAFPFVMLGLGLLSLHDLGAWGWRWWLVDVVWATGAGLSLGYGLGALVGRAVLYLRMRHREALGSDEFIALGLIALAYGVAIAFHAYGFLAVFAAGYALRQIDHDGPGAATATGVASVASEPERLAEEVNQAPRGLMDAVQRFNAQLERFAEVGVVLAVGALLTTVEFRPEALWFVPLLFLVIRPLAVYLGLAGMTGQVMQPRQRRLMAWFGIRGIGSIYYLMYAISHGLDGGEARTLISLTIAVVVASVVAHGVSVTPLMNRYERLKKKRKP